jgi:hypothetical protein
MPNITVDYLNPGDTDITLPNTTQITLSPTASGYAHNNKPVRSLTFDLDNATTATIVTTGSLPDPQIINASYRPASDAPPMRVNWISPSNTTATVEIEPPNTYAGSLSHAGGSVLLFVQH